MPKTKPDLAKLFSLLLASSVASSAAMGCSSLAGAEDTASGCDTYPTERKEESSPLSRNDSRCLADGGVLDQASDGGGGGAPACSCEQLCRISLKQPPKSCSFLAGTKVECIVPQICPGGRKPARLEAPRLPLTDRRTAFLLGCAHMEAASVVSFERLASELSSLGAPQALVARAREAADDEVRHARAMLSLTRGYSIPAVELAPQEPRDAFAIACENAREGCVRETFAALLAQRQGALAADPTVRAVMAEIAADETRHAELSWTLAGWLDEALDAEQREAVAAIRIEEARALRAELFSRGLLEDPDLGLPSAAEAVELLDGLVASLSIAA